MSSIRPAASLRRIAAAAALLATTSAFAGVQGDLGWGVTLNHGDIHGNRRVPVLQVDLGYRFDNNLAIEAVTFNELDFARSFLYTDPNPNYEFESFTGVQALGYLPLNPHFELVGGLGVGRATQENGIEGAPKRNQTDALLTGGIQWHAARHFNLSLDVHYLAQSEVATLMLHTQLSF